ncbi:prepilin peptidase [Anaeromyxobacter dehalogenans]|uniref:Peptidase A24A, prepilin type IV n=1 Tax=Anaeromyxobacter dehalogenans (strain 2CP-C) TaxID=290397 RepID=Q2ILR7_ANADE|nr:prepilin peptidase [Anaeromyxobacter dehalogenans]ABC82600.1 peptidase A24A, prepilin type IV [Anaeromyxobacter dehalogenans 2CP-C]
MTASPLAFGTFGFLLAVAAASDAAGRRISNRITVPLAVGGIAVQAAAGLAGAAGALVAVAAVGALLWVPWSRGWLGGGDWKLAVAAAPWVGLGSLASYLTTSAVAAGGLAAVAWVASGGAARRDIGANLRAAAAGRPLSIPARAAGDRVSVPAGAAFAVGALCAVLLGR